MKISVFEYAYAFDEKKFIVEGKAMLNLIVNGLKKENIQVNKIKIKNSKNYKEEILKNVENTNFTILIAPNYELLNICEFLYEKNLYKKVLISSIDSIRNTLNKWKLYEKLSKEILMPETKIFNNNIDFPFILKPIYGTGCENVYLFNNKISEKILKKFDSNFIIQKFIDGIHCSVSLFCSKEIYPASLNFQRIKFYDYKGFKKLEYKGGIVPYDIHCKIINKKLRERIFEISKKACKILNLKGHIGIDFVIKDNKIYLIEVNPRITTSSIALEKSSNINVAKLHLLCFLDEYNQLKELRNIKFSKIVSFYKYKNCLKFYITSATKNECKNNNLSEKEISGILYKNLHKYSNSNSK